MPSYEYLNLESAAYDVLIGGVLDVELNEREEGILSTMLFLLTERKNWAEMTDAEWEFQENEIQDLIGKLRR